MTKKIPSRIEPEPTPWQAFMNSKAWRNFATEPSIGETVYVRGDDFMGYWAVKVTVFHKNKSLSWRRRLCFKHSDGTTLDDRPDVWMPITDASAIEYEAQAEKRKGRG